MPFSFGSTTTRSLNHILPSIAQAQQGRCQLRAFIAQREKLSSSCLYRARPGTAPVREMATAAAGKKLEWLVILPDYEGVIEKRLQVRAKHLEGVKPLHNENKIIFGGAMFSHPPKEGEDPLPMVGSALLAYAETKEEVMDIIKKDIYSTSGVWDLSKIQIWPFKSALRSDISTTSDLHPIQSAQQGG